MITLIEGLSDDVVGARYSGEITRDDYKDVLEPAIASVVGAGRPVNLLIVLEDDCDHLSLGARLRDVRIDEKYRDDWGRMAFVVDNANIVDLLRDFSKHRGGLARIYTGAEMEQAQAWATGLGA